MSEITKEQILAVLAEIKDPLSGGDVVSEGLITSVFIRDGKVGFALLSNKEQVPTRDKLRYLCEERIKQLAGVREVSSLLTEHQTTEREQKEQRKYAMKQSVQRKTPEKIPGVTAIIAVASGKGGVGKSTTAVNLAVALAELGVRTGLLDADIYGPSIPHMMSIYNKPDVKDNKMIPTERYGVQCVSVGTLIDQQSSIAWRAPMATKALAQLFRGVHWDNVEVLIVDMPPGTGDIHLSLAEHYPIDGAIVVSTPQDIALLDAQRGVDLFNKVSIPIIGLVENMSFYAEADGKRAYIFGENGGKRLAETLNVPFLGEIPLNIDIRTGADEGKPWAISEKKDAETSGFYDFAKEITLFLKKNDSNKNTKKFNKAVS